MPELPEVETVKAALEPHLLGRCLTRIETFTERLRKPLTIAGCPEVLGRPVLALRRRAKFIVVELANGPAIVVHLGMTGSCRIEPLTFERRRHDHVCTYLDNDTVWVYNDPRRFGMVLVEAVGPDGWPLTLFSDLGPEPLSDEFNAAYLFQRARRRSCPLKALIMDNSCVVGVGNIYACEALFRAGIRPTAAAKSVSKARLGRLVSAIQEVLNEAIQAGGTTISDFVTVDGSEGHFNRELRVYGKSGEKCGGCGRGAIRKLVIGGRSTFYCPTCQR